MKDKKIENVKRKKIWFVNITLVLMWFTILFIDVFPDIHIDNQFLATSLYALIAIIPAYLMFEGIGIWKSEGVEVENPYEKEEKEKEQ